MEKLQRPRICGSVTTVQWVQTYKGMRLNHLAKNCTEPATVQGRPGQVDRGSKPSGTQF